MPQLQNVIKDKTTRRDLVRRGKPRAIRVLEVLGVDRVYTRRHGTAPVPLFLWARARTPAAPCRRCFAPLHGETSNPCSAHAEGADEVHRWMGLSPGFDASHPLPGSQSPDDGCIVPVSGKTCL